MGLNKNMSIKSASKAKLQREKTKVKSKLLSRCDEG